MLVWPSILTRWTASVRIVVTNEKMEEHGECEGEEDYQRPPTYIDVCKCILPESKKSIFVKPRMLRALNVVEDTERYLGTRRIAELLRFMLTHILVNLPPNPVHFLEKLLDQCMLFRAGLGYPPVLYEVQHLEAVVKSFDPGDRGWMSAGQVRRAFLTLGLTPDPELESRIPTDEVMNMLKETQERELLELLTAGAKGYPFPLD